MQLNQATDYAFRVILHLSSMPPGSVVNGQRIADTQQIPAQFLQKIMRALCRGGLVNSYRGIDGGFQLARLPEAITLYDVIVALEGPLGIHPCLANSDHCTKGEGGAAACAVHDALASIQNDLVRQLRAVDFAVLRQQQLVCEQKKGRAR